MIITYIIGGFLYLYVSEIGSFGNHNILYF
jgi:ABC-type tungstate transport system substrate-binding protein